RQSCWTPSWGGSLLAKRFDQGIFDEGFRISDVGLRGSSARLRSCLCSTRNPKSEIRNPLGNAMRLGELLIERRLLEPGDLERALELQKERGDKLGKILIDLGFIAAKDLLSALSEQLAVPLVAVDQAPPAAPEIDGISSRFMRQCRFIPPR